MGVEGWCGMGACHTTPIPIRIKPPAAADHTAGEAARRSQKQSLAKLPNAR